LRNSSAVPALKVLDETSDLEIFPFLEPSIGERRISSPPKNIFRSLYIHFIYPITHSPFYHNFAFKKSFPKNNGYDVIID
jgi:hypothetical protein